MSQKSPRVVSRRQMLHITAGTAAGAGLLRPAPAGADTAEAPPDRRAARR
jgi:hypothetical protein